MKALDAGLDMLEVQFKTVTKATQGLYHGVSMGTDTILGERQIQDGRMTLKQLAMIQELVDAGMDRDVVVARFAEIKSEI